MGKKIHCTLQGRNVDFLKYVSSNHASEKKKLHFLKYVSSNHASEKKKYALTNFALTETYIALIGRINICGRLYGY
jgi:hypothetical protein